MRVKGSPDINWVKSTNFLRSWFACAAVSWWCSAIDNLVKECRQAVQNMNLMFGLDEKLGLMLTGGNP